MDGIQLRDDRRRAGIGRFLLGLLQIILNPRQGWMDAALDNYDCRDLITKGLVPLLAVVALTALIEPFYFSTLGFLPAIIKGVVDFTGYFASVYLCNYFLNWALGMWVLDHYHIDDSKVQTLVIYTIASMALMTLIDNVLPSDLAVLSFLPFYVFYIIWCACRYLGIPDERKPYFFGVALGALFLPPYLLSYCLSIFL